MAASSVFDPLARKLGQLEKEMSGEAAQQAMTKIGVEAKKEAVKAVREDLGDESMSGWWKPTQKRPTRKPIPIVTQFDVIGDSVIEIVPRGSAKGPWRVLEEGRKAGTAGEFRDFTKRQKRKDGSVVLKQGRRRYKRNVGASPPKRTWTEAADRILRTLPQFAYRYRVVEPMTRVFKR